MACPRPNSRRGAFLPIPGFEQWWDSSALPRPTSRTSRHHTPDRKSRQINRKDGREVWLGCDGWGSRQPKTSVRAPRQQYHSCSGGVSLFQQKPRERRSWIGVPCYGIYSWRGSWWEKFAEQRADWTDCTDSSPFLNYKRQLPWSIERRYITWAALGREREAGFQECAADGEMAELQTATRGVEAIDSWISVDFMSFESCSSQYCLVAGWLSVFSRLVLGRYV